MISFQHNSDILTKEREDDNADYWLSFLLGMFVGIVVFLRTRSRSYLISSEDFSINSGIIVICCPKCFQKIDKDGKSPDKNKELLIKNGWIILKNQNQYTLKSLSKCSKHLLSSSKIKTDGIWNYVKIKLVSCLRYVGNMFINLMTTEYSRNENVILLNIDSSNCPICSGMISISYFVMNDNDTQDSENEIGSSFENFSSIEDDTMSHQELSLVKHCHLSPKEGPQYKFVVETLDSKMIPYRVEQIKHFYCQHWKPSNHDQIQADGQANDKNRPGSKNSKFKSKVSEKEYDQMIERLLNDLDSPKGQLIVEKILEKLREKDLKKADSPVEKSPNKGISDGTGKRKKLPRKIDSQTPIHSNDNPPVIKSNEGEDGIAYDDVIKESNMLSSPTDSSSGRQTASENARTKYLNKEIEKKEAIRKELQITNDYVVTSSGTVINRTHNLGDPEPRKRLSRNPSHSF